MKTHQGRSFATDPAAAVAECTAGWPDRPQILFCFYSASQDAEGVSRELRERFPGTPVVGCSTAGEHLTGGHSNKTLVLSGVWESSITWATELVRGLSDFGDERAHQSVDRLLTALDVEREDVEPDRHFGMLLIDGLSMSEERVSAALAESLEGIPLAGGSAGDDLAFEGTTVMTEEGVFSDAAVVVLGSKGNAHVECVKHQHYVTTPRPLCITKADPEQRVVFEIDGVPAIEAYAEALDLTPEEVTGTETFMNPLTFSCDGQIYVRSIQRVGDDGELYFYCAIEQGMVVRIGGHHCMETELQRDLESFTERFGKPNFLVGFNCILRALEAEQGAGHQGLADILDTHADAMIGFDTYGEQLDGQHINQTLVAVAIREDDETEEASR